MKMDSLDSLTYGGVRGRENLFNFPSYSIAIKEVKTWEFCNVRIKNNGGIQYERTNESQKT